MYRIKAVPVRVPLFCAQIICKCLKKQKDRIDGRVVTILC
jgi:hypothetical protein